MRWKLASLVVIGLQAGCLAGLMNYGFNNRNYRSKEEAWAAQDRFYEARNDQTHPLDRIAESLLFCIPSDDTLGGPPFVSVVGRGTGLPEQYLYIRESVKKAFEANARMVQKAELFAKVTVMQTDDCAG
jgi:hypothetical protein